MNCISDIKHLIESTLEDLIDDEVIKSYKLLDYRELEGNKTYKVDLYINDVLISRQMGFGNGYNAKINAWRRLATHLIQNGIRHRNEYF